MRMHVSLSILEYEDDLSKNVDNLDRSGSFVRIMQLLETGKINSVHIDIMRPPMIPDKNKFPLKLVKKLCERLVGKIHINLHLMVNDPLKILEDINRFIAKSDRANITVIVQVESFSSEEEAVKSIKLIKDHGYSIGVGLNLPSPEEKLTDKVANAADMILVMTVPMGLGGQSFNKGAVERIKRICERFPSKVIKVDGGINPETMIEAWRAGAGAVVVGSYITLSNDPIRALTTIYETLTKLEFEKHM